MIELRPYEIDSGLRRVANAIGTALVYAFGAYVLVSWLAGWP